MYYCSKEGSGFEFFFKGGGVCMYYCFVLDLIGLYCIGLYVL